jgi:hypothetical protein
MLHNERCGVTLQKSLCMHCLLAMLLWCLYIFISASLTTGMLTKSG